MRHMIVAALLLVSSVAMGSDRDGGYSSRGSQGCGAFSAELPGTPGAVANYAWMQGYITAFNRVAPDTYNILGGKDMKSVESWMGNYCRQNPTKDMSEGMDQLTSELYDRRYKTAKEAGK